MKLYELKVEDEGIDEVFAISLVESPAIESDFLFFNNVVQVDGTTTGVTLVYQGGSTPTGGNAWPSA